VGRHDAYLLAAGMERLLRHHAADRLQEQVTGLVNVFNPEVVVIGGGVLAAGDLLLEPARRVVAEQALRPSREQVRIVPAHFGDEAGMLGAALLALDGLRSGAA
jgi:glucokinase